MSNKDNNGSKDQKPQERKISNDTFKPPVSPQIRHDGEMFPATRRDQYGKKENKE